MTDLMQFQRGQKQMTAYLRDPDQHLPPEGIEQRRLDIYKNLVYNNIEGFISSTFPVLKSLYSDSNWYTLVRRFIADHQCKTPYFFEISQEFIKFLPTLVITENDHPSFLVELAHYEWVELAVDIAEECIGAKNEEATDFLSKVPVVSNLAWSLAYQYPVHQIGPDFQPTEATGQPTYLIVYRNREKDVQFIESNSVTARLLELIRDNAEGNNLQHLLITLSNEISAPNERQIISFGCELIEDFFERGIIIYCH
tara:strand:- start:982 stop:1743 length:762 start_codon:yes stop_codon:yes gene_type:complete